MYYNYHDISLYYEKHGNQGKPIMILPGWGDTRPTFQNLVSALSVFSTVYIIDYPGFGNTKFPNHSMTIFDYADMIHSLIVDLNLENALLIGHSFGGRILTLLDGYYHYKHSHFIFVDCAGIRPKKTLEGWIRGKCYQFLKKVGHLLPSKTKKKYASWLFQKFASPDYQALPENMRTTFQNVVNTDLFYYLRKMKARVLLIWGEHDTSTPLSDAEKMKKEIPNSELIVLKNLGHFPYLERPNWVYQIIMAHLEEIHFFSPKEKTDSSV